MPKKDKMEKWYKQSERRENKFQKKHFGLRCYQRLMGLEDGKFMEIFKLLTETLFLSFLFCSLWVLSLILCHRLTSEHFLTFKYVPVLLDNE